MATNSSTNGTAVANMGCTIVEDNLLSYASCRMTNFPLATISYLITLLFIGVVAQALFAQDKTRIFLPENCKSLYSFAMIAFMPTTYTTIRILSWVWGTTFEKWRGSNV